MEIQSVKDAIEYFEDTVREIDEIMPVRSPTLQAELEEQKRHFGVALEVLRAQRDQAEPMTNADRIRSMNDEELAQFLYELAYAQKTPWSLPFYKQNCNQCPTVKETIEGQIEPEEFYECEFVDGDCPHGSEVVWWLQQSAAGGTL